MTPELPIVLRRCRHGPMFILATDRYIGGSLQLLGEFSEGEVRLFHDLVGPGDTVVEAGSHIGAHTIPLAQKVGPGGRVIAFEPQWALHRVLRANIALNNLAAVADARLAAVDEAERALHVPILDYSVVDNFGGFPDTLAAFTDIPHKSFGHETVPAMTIDGLGLSSCALIKMDVEGMELPAIGGALATIERLRPALYLEANPGKARALLVSLDAMGYRLWRHTPPLFSAANLNGVTVDPWPNTYSANILAVPAERPFGSDLEARHGLRLITDPFIDPAARPTGTTVGRDMRRR